MSDAARPQPPSRLIQLDVLRGIAVLMVLFNHTPAGTPADGPIRDLVRPIEQVFWTGVDLFFVLSGFLVGGLLIAELRKSGRIDLKRFWIRRGLKIWPSYYLYLAVLAVVTALFYVDSSLPGAQRAGLLVNSVKLVYLQNYFPSWKAPFTSHGLGTHTWTLAVEEHFYILLPLVLLAAGRFWRRAVPAVTFVLLIGCLALRLRTWDAPMDWIWDYGVTHKRIDSLFWGVFLAYLSQLSTGFTERVARARGLIASVGLLLVAPMLFLPLGSAFVKTIGYTLLALGYGCIVLAVVSVEPGKGVAGRFMMSRTAKALGWVGFWSYSIYLWHMELSHLFTYLSARGDVWFASATLVGLPGTRLWGELCVVLYLAVAIAGGALLGHLIERPVLLWRDRRFPSRAAAPTPPLPVEAAGAALPLPETAEPAVGRLQG